MTKRIKIYLLLIGITLVGIVYAELTKPKQINWFASYTTHHKIPFGSYIFKQLTENRFDSVVPVNRPPYEFLKNNSISGTYLFYNNGLGFGDTEWESLLNWTSKGNTLIIASTNFEKGLLDTLQLRTSITSISDNFNNSYELALVHPDLQSNKQIVFDKAKTLYHFNKMDSSATKVVGIIDKYDPKEQAIKDTLVNVVKKPLGDGAIILSTFPQAFTNYFILQNSNKDYTAGIMSYINPEQPLYLDTYYKSGKSYYASPLYLFLNNHYLKWAYYMLLIGVVLYIIFEGKRTQRAIPVVKPLKNQTLDYTRTIANMYYEKNAHNEIFGHIIQHFMSYIRSHLNLQTAQIDQEFLKQLAARSNNDLDEVTKLMNFIKKLQEQNSVTKEELERLNKLIENFKFNNKWKSKI